MPARTPVCGARNIEITRFGFFFDFPEAMTTKAKEQNAGRFA